MLTRTSARYATIAILAGVLLIGSTASGDHIPGIPNHGLIWVAPATAVVGTGGGNAPVDAGVVICNVSNPTLDSVGGGCLPFSPPNDSVLVDDFGVGGQVAFQVCIDNNGDRVCRGRSNPPAACDDDLFFSHFDGGIDAPTGSFIDFFNPVGPIPTGFRPGCPPLPSLTNPGPFSGYVVLICQGVHTVEGDTPVGMVPSHAHPAAAGQIFLLNEGVDFDQRSIPPLPGPTFGDFCAPSQDVPAKRYVVN
ncbi:MAG: hypothetical protein ACRDIF_07095 [Actinomycetota bacterium]